MSHISDKYLKDDEALRSAIKDGLISPSWIKREEIHSYFKTCLSNSSSKTEAVKKTAKHFDCEPAYIFKIINLAPFK